MSTLVLPDLPVEKGSIVPADETLHDSVRRHVGRLLAGLSSPGRFAERRVSRRYPFPFLIRLTPVDAAGTARPTESTVVVGRDLSERGVRFYHQQPLPHRRVIASLSTRDDAWIDFLLDLNWCRFTSHGWYVSGGRFLEVVFCGSPVEG